MKQNLIFILLILFFTTNINAKKDLNNVFPLNNYPQYLNFWFNENNTNYKTVYLSKEIQKLYFNILKDYYYGQNSPWNPEYIKYLINPEPNTAKTIFNGETIISNIYKNSIYYPQETNSTLYGMNFRRLDKPWINKIIENMDLNQFQNIIYNTKNRAISIDRTLITALPSHEDIVNTYKIAGSGYPFKLNNLSLIAPGTPVYILGTSKDKGWYFIVGPGIMGWAKASNIAKVNNSFINLWKSYANRGLGSILTSDLAITDTENNYHFTTIGGTLLPIYKKYSDKLVLMIPVKTSNNFAIIKYTQISTNDSAVVPLELNMANFAKVIKSLIGKNYGWGGTNYFNDCSLELMTIYRSFGIFLTRNSMSQATYSGQIIDISNLTKDLRKEMIIKNGLPFTTFIYFKGHIMIYIGTYQTNYSNKTIMTYQNIWGLSPKNKSYRDIIGKAVIFPLLDKYPENSEAMPLISKQPFMLVNLVKPINLKIGLSNLLY